MNAIVKCMAFSVSLLLLSQTHAGEGDAGVVTKVENAVERGARAAASGVEHGVRAAASGVERGAKAAGRGVEKGAKATTNAASHVANKIAGKPAPSASGDK
jgi:hypothetical protein